MDRVERVAWPALWVLLSVGCAPSAEVLFDIHTDLTPGRDFDAVRVALSDTERMEDAGLDQSWIRGVRVGPLLSAIGPQSITAELLSGGRVVVSRRLGLSISGTVVIPVYLLRSCVDVACPMTGDPGLTECQDGRCVPPTCIEGDEGGCPDPSCALTSECPDALVDCAERQCIDGHCLISASADGCTMGFACDVMRGCVPFMPMLDAGMRDGGGVDGGSPDGALPDVPAVDAPTTGCTMPCDDGDACTHGDRCVGDACEGTSVTCTSDECIDRTCNGTSACTEIIRAGRVCSDDGNPCTDDRCGAGGNCRHNDVEGLACDGGTCCGGACQPESTSNCGACGARCASGESCSGGRCVCGGTTGSVGGGAACGGVSPACCSGSCSDLDSDYLNCGACGAPRCGDQFGDCIGGACGCGGDPRCSGAVTCCRCGPGGAGSFCSAPASCPC